MDKKEKAAKKKIVQEKVDLTGGRFTDYEVEKLLDFVSNPDRYAGKTKTIRHSGRAYCSDGNYFWNDEATYTIRNDETGARIEKDYYYHDDEYNREEHAVYQTGRGVLKVLGEIFRL